MIIEIEALDTLFFRDGKPFEKSDDVWATGMFPPLPSVIYGALRSAYLGQNDIGLEEVEEATSGLRIRNVAYYVNIKNRDEETADERLQFPSPLDLVIEKYPDKKLTAKEKRDWEDDKRYYEKEFNSFDGILLNEKKSIGNTHLTKLAKKPKQILGYNKDIDVESLDEGFIDKSLLEDYFKGTAAIEMRNLSQLYKSEPKIGISRNNDTRTTSEGNLYRVGMLRTNNIKIVVEFDGLFLNDKGLLKLGGENRLATYGKVEETPSPNIEIDIEGEDFKIYLATPAIFKEGYFPSTIFNNKDFNVEAELISCFVGKYINIGGFDMINKQPKKMQKAVPAGSVYHYKLKGDLEKFFAYIKEHGISEFENEDKHRQKEGFGIAYISNIII
jgi:CRISPR-associated protein Cmr3